MSQTRTSELATVQQPVATRRGNPAAQDGDAGALWAAVVMQARTDIEFEPLESLDYAQAVSFFIGRGEWALSRAVIADFLDLHADDIELAGRACINQRRAKEGLPPLAKAERRQPVAASRGNPIRVAARPAPPMVRVVPAPAPVEQEPTRRRYVRRSKGVPSSNPFFPRGIPDFAELREAA
ncbi:MAG: hypothetical protein J0H67_08380 [Rhodospirillales bacterium]|nr:hypothetical protein [Rhodospirillales bacterium]